MVRTVGQSGNSLVSSYGLCVVVLDAGDGLPRMREPQGIKIVGDGIEIHCEALPLRGLLDSRADSAPHSLVWHEVEARAATTGRRDDQWARPRIVLELERPILSVL